MAPGRRRRPWRTVGLLGLAVAVLAVVRPWTVRPLVTPAPAFEASSYAEEAWPRVVAEADRDALDLAAWRAAAPDAGGLGTPARKAAFVRVSGTVAEIDRRSRVGVAWVRAGDGAPAEVTVQVGPVIRGTALRDAASFIRFNDFANQFEFAAVSNALHERVLQDVVGPLDLDGLVGKSITVLGAAIVPAGTADAAIDIVPIRIGAGGGAR